MERRIDPLYSFHLLGQACVGVLMGTLFALLLAGLLWPIGGRPLVMPDELLSWNLHNTWPKPREQGFYLLALLFGMVGAYLTTNRFYVIRLIPLYLGLMASVPITNYLARQVLTDNNSFLMLFAIAVMVVLFCIYANRKALALNVVRLSPTSNVFRWWPYSVFALIIILLLLPASYKEVAAHIGMQFHLVSFLIGPALYFLGDHYVPGIDYFTQYSMGMGWLFSHLLGSTAEKAILHYVYLVLLASWLFYTHLLYLLYWLYRSWVPASIVTLLSLILLFHTTLHFFDPSSSVLRYPLLGICAWFLAHWIKQPRSITRHLALASTIALSVLFNTETGIIFGVAVTFAGFFSAHHPFSMLLPLISLGIASLALLLLLLLAIFGLRILQIDFLGYLLEPLLVYGKLGFGGTPIIWYLNDLNWFYNLVAPGVSLATLALIARRARSDGTDQARMAVLAFFTISGLLMLMKFINMSLIALWQMNALGFLVPLGWWGMVLAERFKGSKLKFPFLDRSVSAFSIIWGLLIVGAIWLTAFTNDIRNPSEYGLRSWYYYPSLIHSFFDKRKSGCATFHCVANRPAQKDVALIKQRTQPGEPVAIIDLYDWTYLISAHRPPLMYFIPSEVTFTKNQLVKSLDRLKDAPYLFLPKGENQEPNILHDDFRKALLPTFHDLYTFDGEGERLVAWRRKNLIINRM